MPNYVLDTPMTKSSIQPPSAANAAQASLKALDPNRPIREATKMVRRGERRDVPLSDFRLPFVESHLSALSWLHSL